ncbi:glycosyltransferase family 4 protein [Botrimarina sp.]|uniref:glycosyltransferase family 4 protein n=1 Tax=Botrimarina sp. TaxID=2795802 RepID=UPI0032EFF540
MITSTASLMLLRGQLARMRQEGYEVTLVSSPGDGLDAFCESEGVAYRTAPMKREISPLADLVSLLHLTWLFVRLRPTIVNSSTPKAGLLGTLAATLALAPGRVYVLRGLRLETTRGFKRRVLWLCEWLACRLANRVVCISPSLREVAVEIGICPRRKASVIGAGSSNGVDLQARPYPFSRAAAATRVRLRRKWGVPDAAFVFGAVGRITRDKGIEEVVEAYREIASSDDSAWLVLIGAFERGDAVSDECVAEIERNPRIVSTGFIGDTSDVYAALDVLVHASRREGFGNAPLEAAAAGLPVVGRRVTGVVDAVADGVTGVLIDEDGKLAPAMWKYLHSDSLRLRHGAAGRARVEALFTQESVWRGLAAIYQGLGRGIHPNAPHDAIQTHADRKAA